MPDRTECARALAKAIAHKNAGNDDLTNEWAAYLVALLDAADILAPEYVAASGVSRPTR